MRLPALFAPDRPRPRFSHFRQPRYYRWSLGFRASLGWRPHVQLRLGTLTWEFSVGHADDCSCGECIPF